jgi:hypothetical protein
MLKRVPRAESWAFTDHMAEKLNVPFDFLSRFLAGSRE